MKKQILSLITAALALSACQSQPLSTLPTAQSLSVSQPQATTQTKPAARAQTSRPTPHISTATQTSTPLKKPAVSLRKPAAVEPRPAAPVAESAPSAPVADSSAGPEILLSNNYNTQTLVAGLKPGLGRAEAEAIALRNGMSVERFIASIHTVVYKTNGQAVPALLEALQGERQLAFVEADQVATQKPENEKEITESFQIFAVGETNDKYFADQYGLQSMHVPAAWELNRGAGTVVAVIDTGVDLDHADLKDRLVEGYDAFSLHEGPREGDVSSLNYLMSSYKHGSHVAGIIAAEANNGKGIAGVAPDAKIMPIKIFPDISDVIKSLFAPGGDESQTIVSILADSIVWAADHGADVINMSLAVNEPSAAIDRAVKYALDKNVSVIVAAGNDRQNGNARNYLAAIPGVVGVGATDASDTITAFSNSGDYVSVAAPGFDVISTVPSFLNFKSYVKMSGTSMAAPHVAGVAALLKGKFGAKATPAWIKSRLEHTAVDRGTAGRDDLYGYGLVDAAKALAD